MWAVVPPPAPDTIAEMREKRRTRRPADNGCMSSRATNALKTPLSRFHRGVKISLAIMDATVEQPSVFLAEKPWDSKSHLTASCRRSEHGLSQLGRSGHYRLRR